MTESRIAVADDALFDEHHARGYHPERPERLGAARRAIERCEAAGATLDRLAPRDATESEIARVHAPAYVESLARFEGHHAQIDADTYIAPKSVAAARRAAGAAIACVDALLSPAPPATSVALVRPPGHHATRAEGMGFCLVNNAAVAAAHALSIGLSRVAIVDWDVHHGNGTQDIFYADPRVLYVSLHQMPLYPGTGRGDEMGAGDGAFANLNVPLSPDATDATYASAFERAVVPAIERFAPELVLLSAGFDAHARDPLAAMRVTDAGYQWMASALAAAARPSAAGRIAVVLEGGYDLSAIETSLFATIQGLVSPNQARPLGPVGPHHVEEIARAEAHARDVLRF